MESDLSASKSATNSLDRALAILDLLLSLPEGLIHSELARLLGVPSSTCTYIINKLVQGGHLRRDNSSRRFKLGLKTISLAHGALHGLGFRSISESVLYRLTVETGLSAGIGVRQGNQVLVVDRVEGLDIVDDLLGHKRGRVRSREHRDIGRALPLHSTALGKVLLASLDKAERNGLLTRLNLRRWTKATVWSESDLREQLDAIRKQGYALAEEEHYNRVRALAVPIRDRANRTRAALSLNGPSSAIIWNSFPVLLAQVQSAAREIAHRSDYLLAR